jgi:hypothetical protein
VRNSAACDRATYQLPLEARPARSAIPSGASALAVPLPREGEGSILKRQRRIRVSVRRQGGLAFRGPPHPRPLPHNGPGQW